jgi:hypothetical protein
MPNIDVGSALSKLNDVVGAYDGLVDAWNNIPARTEGNLDPVFDALSAGAAALGALAASLPPGWSQVAGVGGLVGSGAAFLKSVVDLNDAISKGEYYKASQKLLAAGAAGAGFLAGVLPPPAKLYAAGVSVLLTLAKNSFPLDAADALDRQHLSLNTDSIRADVNQCYKDACKFVPRRDPLVLDLDGDGLELTAASGNVLFDHNADGIKTGTGWVKPDDGFLVRDINGNGTIDSGRELFGVDTIKSNSALATDGFDALRDLDSNHDGYITSADAAFGELKIWQDANQDGISQSSELKTLAQLNITRIGVNGTTTGPQASQVINNNLVALSGTFTQSGQTKTVGAIDLETNNFFTEFPPELVDQNGSPVPISAQAQALPQMNGSGMVRNMQAAASLDSSFASALQTYASSSHDDQSFEIERDICVMHS